MHHKLLEEISREYDRLEATDPAAYRKMEAYLEKHLEILRRTHSPNPADERRAPKILHFQSEQAHSKYEAHRHIHGEVIGAAPPGQKHIIESTGRVHRVKHRIVV